jgi:hypothetical protein
MQGKEEEAMPKCKKCGSEQAVKKGCIPVNR